MPNKRHYERISFVENAQILLNNTIYNCSIIDISLKGTLLQFAPDTMPTIEANQQATITLALAGSTITLQFQAIATHFNTNTVGFCFTSMDSDSITHLRRMLELNTGDSAEIDRELHYMIKNL